MKKKARHFDGFASQLGLKADGQTSLLAKVSAFENLRILTGQPVQKLLGDDTNPHRILGMMLENGQRYTADNILLAAGALHSPRLLQDYLEASGLTRTLPCSRLVGRYFKRHILTAMLTFSPSRKTDVLRKTMAWFNDGFPHRSIQLLGFGEDVIDSLIPGTIPPVVGQAVGQPRLRFFPAKRGWLQ
jgi:choline dehydrogenase-like flavoprotein